MKVSVSDPRRVAYVVAAALLAAHVPFVAPSLEDIDSINFALGLRDFDPAKHQPHPPGSPVYIALGRALLALVSIVRPALDQITRRSVDAWHLVAHRRRRRDRRVGRVVRARGARAAARGGLWASPCLRRHRCSGCRDFVP